MQNMTLDQLRAAAAAGGVLSVTLRGKGAGFIVSIETRRGEVALVKTRGKETRRFADPRKALLLLREVGIQDARIDARDWRPEEAESEKTSRPDRRQALKAAHEAAEHDRWFRTQVKEAIREADDPNTQWVSHEEAQASWAKKRAELLKRIEGGNA
jgi:hypothetical protein